MIIVVYMVEHRSVLIGMCRGRESLEVMLGSSGMRLAELWLFILLWARIGGCRFWTALAVICGFSG